MDYNVCEAKRASVKNDYGIKLSFFNEVNKVIVSFPENLLKKPFLPAFQITYEFVEDGILKQCSDDKHVTKFECPSYTSRLIVISDIIAECGNRDLSCSLIYIEDDEDVLDIEDIMENISVIQQDEENEEKLKNVLYKVLNQEKVPDSIIADVEDGYLLLCSIFRNGGI